MKAILILLCLGFFSLSAKAQYAPAVGQFGCTAIHKDSIAIMAWANQCTVILGWQNIADHSLGKTTTGSPSSAIGIADNDVISLGDGGTAILQFAQAIANGPGPDFAIFENAFDNVFLELALVEVSSDGQNYFRFPAHSLTQTDSQITTFGTLEATKLHNLAGKYRAAYGTPFDLEELKNIAGLNIMHITHIKIIDVVGSINDAYATLDSAGNKINDPYPTPFAIGGFDLDAVAALHLATALNPAQTSEEFSFYPNPVNDWIFFTSELSAKLEIYSLLGRLVLEKEIGKGIDQINISNLATGVYFLRISTENKVRLKRFVKN